MRLILRTEHLAELTTDDLADVVGAAVGELRTATYGCELALLTTISGTRRTCV